MFRTTYTTDGGETWDMIAFALWGDEYRMTDLQRANPQYLHVIVFDAGVVLDVPLIEDGNSEFID